jgi:hypothetical protein
VCAEGGDVITDAQRRLLNAACGDLADYVVWHGARLDRDDWRHLLSGTVLGWRTVRGVDRGEGAPGLVLLGGSSLKLTKDDARDAITLAFSIGDDPSSQGLEIAPIRWGAAVVKARFLLREGEQ